MVIGITGAVLTELGIIPDVTSKGKSEETTSAGSTQAETVTTETLSEEITEAASGETTEEAAEKITEVISEETTETVKPVSLDTGNTDIEYTGPTLEENVEDTIFKFAVPEYKGNAEIVIAGNKPWLDKAEAATEFIKFSKFDEYDRTRTAYGNIGSYCLPTAERGDIGDIKPTGWEQEKYPGIVDSDPPYLYNRCHLLAYCLTGSNEAHDIFTGTRQLNVMMEKYESRILNYITENPSNHVLYKVSPVYRNEFEHLAYGVHMEALSVETDDISFNVFIFNRQEGITIDYLTGESKLGAEETTEAATEKTTEAATEKTTEAATEKVTESTTEAKTESKTEEKTEATTEYEYTYILNKNTKKIHQTWCSSVSDMKERNKKVSHKSIEELENSGYVCCQRCF